MGTTYTVKYDGEVPTAEINAAMDSLFQALNQQVSTYIPSSLISQFNTSEETKLDYFEGLETHGHFYNNLEASQKVYLESAGYFDPTVMPLVNLWGFGYEKKEEAPQPDDTTIEETLSLVGMDKLNIELSPSPKKFSITKSVPGVQLDFSALAKGYGVDLAANYLNKRGIKNFLVEIGGEVYCQGKKDNGEEWIIGINTPKEDAKIYDFEAKVKLTNKGLATSGNYRNFYKVGDKKYAHTINPKTGKTELSNLLSVTVISDNCMMADAYATAFMAMGMKKAEAMVERDPSLEAYFIFSDEEGNLETSASAGMKDLLMNN